MKRKPKNAVLLELTPTQYETLLMLTGKEESRLSLSIAKSGAWLRRAKEDLGRKKQVIRHKNYNIKHKRMRSLFNAVIKAGPDYVDQ